MEWPLPGSGEKEMNEFCIKGEYTENLNPQYCDRKESSIKNQFFIYEDVFESNKDRKFEKVVDLGCGYAGKLMHFFKSYETIGFDYGKNIEFCKNKFPDRCWCKLNLENSCPEGSYENSLILCVDVIEHLVDPSCLLNYLSSQSDKNTIIMSTPNKAMRKGEEQSGPPKHKDHVREWTKEEFQEMLDKFDIGLTVNEVGRYLIAS